MAGGPDDDHTCGPTEGATGPGTGLRRLPALLSGANAMVGRCAVWRGLLKRHECRGTGSGPVHRGCCEGEVFSPAQLSPRSVSDLERGINTGHGHWMMPEDPERVDSPVIPFLRRQLSGLAPLRPGRGPAGPR
jgi:hypothetical protein